MKYARLYICLLLANVVCIKSAYAVINFNCHCASGSNYYSTELGHISYKDRVEGDFSNYLSHVYNGDYRMHCSDYFVRTAEPNMYLFGGYIQGYAATWPTDIASSMNLVTYANSGEGFSSVEDWLTGLSFSSEDYSLSARNLEEASITPYPLSTHTWEWRHHGYFSVAQTQDNSGDIVSQAISIYDSDQTGIASCINIEPNQVVIGNYGSGGIDTSGYSCNFNGLVDPSEFTGCTTASYRHSEDINFPLLDTIGVSLAMGEVTIEDIHVYENISDPIEHRDGVKCVYIRTIADGVKATIADREVFPEGVLSGSLDETVDTGWLFFNGQDLVDPAVPTDDFEWPGGVHTVVSDYYLGSEERDMDSSPNEIQLHLNYDANGDPDESLNVYFSWHIKGEADIDVSTVCSFLLGYDTTITFPSYAPKGINLGAVHAEAQQSLCPVPGS